MSPPKMRTIQESSSCLRFAGAAVECDDALLVNPYDPESVASAIARALEMPLEERRERHQATFRALSRNPVAVWSKKFIQSLEPTLTVGTPPLVTEELASIGRSAPLGD